MKHLKPTYLRHLSSSHIELSNKISDLDSNYSEEQVMEIVRESGLLDDKSEVYFTIDIDPEWSNWEINFYTL